MAGSEADRAPHTERASLVQLALLALVSAGVGLLWWRFNAPPPQRGLQYPGDLINYFYPLNALAAARWSAGELPLWNPHACSGIPLLATLQVAAFYPATWLSVWLGPERGMPAAALVQCALAGWFAALLFRAWRLEVLASALGGVLFVFACVLGQTFWPAEVSTLVWLPWLLLCAERLTQQWRWRWWLGLAAGTTLALLAGFPQLAVYAFYLWTPFAALRVWQRSRDTAASRAPRDPGGVGSGWLVAAGLVAAVALGAGIAAVQLLPTLEMVAESERAAPLTAADAEYLRHTRLPTLFRNALDPAPKLISFDFGGGMGYLGCATLLWLAAGLAAGWRRALTWLLAAAAVVFALLSDGPSGSGAWLYRVYESLPTGATFRTPERLRVLSFFCIVAIAARGLHACGNAAAARERRLALVAAALAAVVIVLLGPDSVRWRAGAALVLLVALAASARLPMLRAPARVGIAAFVLFDLAHATGPHGSLRSFPGEWAQSFHTRNHAIVSGAAFEALQQRVGLDRIEIVGEVGHGLRIRPPLGVGPIAAAQRMSCYEPLVPRAWSTLARATGHESFTLENLPMASHAAIYDAASVGLVVSLREADPDRSVEERVAALTRDAGYYARGDAPRMGLPDGVIASRAVNATALPRAYWIGSYRVGPSEQTLAELAAGDVDLHTAVWLERDPGLAQIRGAPLAQTIAAYTPERVVIDVAAPAPGILVLTDTHYPGWRARLDGEPVEILRANGLHRGVVVPGGSSRVVFEYAPASLRWGAAVSTASLLALAAVPIAARRRTA